MKRKATLVLLVVMLLSCAAFFSACGGTEHAHTFDRQVAEQNYLCKKATCTEKAQYYFSCECGEKGTETFAYGEPLGHYFCEWQTVRQPTATEPGLRLRKCTRKGCFYSESEDIPALTHTHEYTEKAVSDEYLASAATCTEKATYFFSCKCGAKGTATFTYGEANGHTYSSEWSHDEVRHWHASTCGHDVRKDEAAHTFNNRICTVCSYEKAIPVKSVSLDRNEVFLTTDETVDLIATLSPSDATAKIRWSSSDSSVATVTAEGKVTAISKGTATVTAAAGDKRAICTVYVTASYAGFEFTQNGNSVAITSYFGTDTEVTVPARYQGKPVTVIAERAFYDCSDVIKIVLPDTIKEIGSSAFGYCTALTDIEIPSCTRALDYAFIGCSSIKAITLPDGVVSIGAGLFKNCTSLKKVTILSGAVQQNTFAESAGIEEIVFGENVSSVARLAFANCQSLKYLTLPEINTTTPFNEYYFGLSSVKYTYNGSGSEELYPSKVTSYTVGNRVFGLPADDADWYYDGTGMIIDGKTYIYDDTPVEVSSYQRWYESTVGVYYRKPKTWKATFSYAPPCPLTRLTITNQLISIYDRVLKNCDCLVDVKQKFPIESVTLVGKNEVYLDEFNLSDYTLTVKRTDGYVERFTFGTEYLQSNVNDLKTSGKKTLSFGYGGVSGKFDLSLMLHTFTDVTMDDLAVACDNSPKSLVVKGAPDGTTITYKNNGQTKVGEYTVTATLTNPYYETKTLTAKLSIRQGKYALIYVLNNDEAENENPGEYEFGKTLLLSAPQSTSAVFDGWYLDADYQNKFDGKIEADAYGDITVYAKWNSYFLISDNTITGLTAAGKNTSVITIPKTIGGVSVTSIGSAAFGSCSRLTSVTIPDGVTSIGKSAFAGCSSLTSVTIPNSVTSIGDSAFEGCSSLASVTIGNSVTSIKSYTFIGCSSLTSVTIPNSVTSIGNSAFNGCSSLTSVTIGNGVTSIKSYTFIGCSSLTSVNYLGTIDQWAKIEFNDSGANPLSYAHNLYINNQLVTEANLTTATKISVYAFYGCSSLTSVTIGNSVTSIENFAFDGCSSLTSITIPDSVTSIGSAAFGSCSRLTSVTIGNGVTSIGDSAFNGCSSLTSVTIPYSVTLIGWSAFEGCSSLTSVTIPDGVTSIGDSAFKGCSSLTSVTIPDGVTSIGNSAFAGCSSLTSVTIPDGVTSIGKSAFAGCSSLTSVTIGNSVTSIENFAFDGCSRLTSITIPDSVTSIESYAFKGCSSLKNIYYKGTAVQWNKISIASHNGYLTGADRYYYRETAPALNSDGTAYDGNYWHYDSDGITPVIWKKKIKL